VTHEANSLLSLFSLLVATKPSVPSRSLSSELRVLHLAQRGTNNMRPEKNLEQKRNVLQKRINEDVEKKHVLELRINEEFKALKKVEVSIEKGMEVQQNLF
jgi:hypothetical protein